ncbi:MAG TPA: tetratricopeptide repeat protein [Myxococcota bacterium]|nr:tetratricopeptide repeat protein [Myxococcota bacterium]
MKGYSVHDAARICRLSSARLRYWERTALVRPSLTIDSAPLFGFRDLVCIKAILVLIESGVPLRRIRRSLESVRAHVPEIDRPLGALRVWIEGSDRVVVRHDGVLLQPDGQTVLDFRLAPERADDVACLEARRPGKGVEPDPESALEWFERGCRLDGEAETQDEASAAYRRCLEADPSFADARCNLATVDYNQGRRDAARAGYEHALALEPDHVEANFNLANLCEEEGRNEAALHHYKVAMRADPLYPDVQLNVALLYEKLGLRRKAREHWRRYLQLEPLGSWAEIARKHLAE